MLLVIRRVPYWWKLGCFTIILRNFPPDVKNIIFTGSTECEVALTHVRWDWNEHQKWTFWGEGGTPSQPDGGPDLGEVIQRGRWGQPGVGPDVSYLVHHPFSGTPSLSGAPSSLSGTHPLSGTLSFLSGIDLSLLEPHPICGTRSSLFGTPSSLSCNPSPIWYPIFPIWYSMSMSLIGTSSQIKVLLH